MSASFLHPFFFAILPFLFLKIDIFSFLWFPVGSYAHLRWKGLSCQELLMRYHSHIEVNCRLVPLAVCTSNPPLYGSNYFPYFLPLSLFWFSSIQLSRHCLVSLPRLPGFSCLVFVISGFLLLNLYYHIAL